MNSRRSTSDCEPISEEFLVETVKRAPLFDLLRDGPCDSAELVAELDASRSTIHRATTSFVEEGLLRECEEGFELTGFGRTVADEVADFQAQVASANRLGTFLNTIEPASVDVPVERFADADVVHQKPRQPHFAVKRIIELIEESESVQLFSSVISPFYVEVAYREMMNGTEIDAVFDREVLEIVASEYDEQAAKAAETGLFDVWVRDEVPFELFVFDDCVGMAAHDDGGIARAFVETDSPEAVEWAEDVYESYKDGAERIDLSVF